jgi:uracil-DNA glycosylase
LKKNRDEILKDARERLAFLSEIGAGFVARRPKPEGLAAPEPDAAPGPAVRNDPSLSVPASAFGLSFDALVDKVLICRLCRLSERRTKAVPGQGNREAELMFVGEGPGRDEDVQGLPFVGRAGNLLTKIIEAMKYTRDQVYIANVVKCRPPENRTPFPDEMAACGPYLLRQIELIRPRAIVALGKTATDFFIPGRASMGERRGVFAEFKGIRIMPTYHPSYLVRNEGNRDIRRQVWEDMQKVMEFLGKK